MLSASAPAAVAFDIGDVVAGAAVTRSLRPVLTPSVVLVIEDTGSSRVEDLTGEGQHHAFPLPLPSACESRPMTCGAFRVAK